jgi:hypothetical protein
MRSGKRHNDGCAAATRSQFQARRAVDDVALPATLCRPRSYGGSAKTGGASNGGGSEDHGRGLSRIQTVGCIDRNGRSGDNVPAAVDFRRTRAPRRAEPSSAHAARLLFREHQRTYPRLCLGYSDDARDRASVASPPCTDRASTGGDSRCHFGRQRCSARRVSTWRR